MKINELISDFEIYKTNEEAQLLEHINEPQLLSSFDERDQVIINNLIRKSLISTYNKNGHVLVIRNDQ